MVDAENANQANLTIASCEYLGTQGYEIDIIKSIADWSQPHSSQWEIAINKLGVEAIHHPASRKKKSSSDIALCVHAMEVIYTRSDIQALVLISSDGDFTPLAQKAKSRGIRVVGIGNRDTPLAFRKNCHQWYYNDFFLKEISDAKQESHIPSIAQQIDTAIEMGKDEATGQCSGAKLGVILRRNNPELIMEEHIRSGRLLDLIKSLAPKYEIIKTENGWFVKRTPPPNP